jgi:methionyl aminopeptidase
MADFENNAGDSNSDEPSQNSTESPIASRICATLGCGKLASLVCPTCLKLNLVPAKFCDQECFTKSWNVHKEAHKVAKKVKALTAMPPEFRNYVFTGKLRPGLLSAPRTVPDHIARPDYASHPLGISATERLANSNRDIIKVHSKEEIEGIRLACKIGREVLDIAGSVVRAGITCDEIDRIVHEAIVERGAYPSPLNYHNFKKSLCTSVNEVICHGIPDSRELQPGDIVNCDISVYKDGYHSDLNETFFVGEVDEDSRRLVQCAYEALAAAVATVKPGALYR